MRRAVKGHYLKPAKGQSQKVTRVFPHLSIPTKKPPRESLRKVRIIETNEVGLLLKKTDKDAIVYLRKKFPLDEIEILGTEEG